MPERPVEKIKKSKKKKSKKTKKKTKNRKEKKKAREATRGDEIANDDNAHKNKRKGRGESGGHSKRRRVLHDIKPLPPHSRVLAPMVGASELAFRVLCRRYGADLCYT